MLIVESGVRFHLTNFTRTKECHPRHLVLRKHVRGDGSWR